MFTSDIQNPFVIETSRYLTQMLDRPFTVSSSKSRGKPVTINEVRAFFGYLTSIGLSSLGDVKEYWSDELGQDRIKNVFSYHRDIFSTLWKQTK